MERSVIIIGGGAAGLCAAILLGRAGKKVTLLEQNDRVGKKILVSGNGKCNIGNRHIAPSRFHGNNPGFISTVLDGYDADKIEKFFHSIGLALTEGKEGKLFPLSMQAASVAELLEYAAKEAGVEIVCECRATHIERAGEGFVIKTTCGEKRAALLITAGSPAAPQLGGSDSGYIFATALGHSLIPRHPALVQLVSKDTWVKQCAGVKVEGVATLYANGEYVTEKRGDLLFTNYGISGLAVLDISREVSTRLAVFDYCELSLDLMPAFSKEKLTRLFLAHLKPESKKPLLLWLQGFMHKKLANVILAETKTVHLQEKDLNRKIINRLVHAIKHLRLSIDDTKGFQHAEVATGGIDTQEIDPLTMQSKIVPHLYFAGEVLDVDGDRGGFNFHFAWVSAMRAAEAIGVNESFF
ncbi:MAG: aminoacetone oxidase family FAD-binding enzyme [Sulfurovum sp.]|nr:aminoacetone oxidase family FAD-binding enzyme [Sulfurovum sp.]